MKHTIRNYFSAAVLLLCGAAALAGCSQNDDALPAGTAVAQGGEPLNICIAPKPGYTESANTRVTVNNETGAFAWEAGDNIKLRIVFNDAANTRIDHELYYSPGKTDAYINDWGANDSNQSGQPVSKIVWPLGASSATVAAFYLDMSCDHSLSTGVTFYYNTGETGDYMLFSKTLSLGEGLTVDFAHGITRLVFTGLAASTAYKLKAAGADLTFPKHLTADFTTFDVMEAVAFTSDASGNLTVCADLDEKIDSNGKLKLELVKNGETTAAYQTTLTAQGTARPYKMDGYIYKINVGGTGGEVHPGNYNDLIKVPAPIVAGNIVYELNGFYVTIPDADAKKLYQWASSETATAMENNPCAGHGKWRLPTMEEFEKMSGFYGQNFDWTQNADETFANPGSCDLETSPVFLGHTAGSYWSSDVATSPTTSAWTMACDGTPDTTNANLYGWAYKKLAKTSTAWVRCVQPK